MIETYKKIFMPAFIWGMIGGSIIIILFFAKRTLHFPGKYLLVANCASIFLLMIASVFFYRKNVGAIGFTIAREMSFLVYFIAATVLMIFRFIDGYFYKFSPPVAILSVLGIYGLGRIVSYFIGMNMYNLKSDK